MVHNSTRHHQNRTLLKTLLSANSGIGHNVIENDRHVASINASAFPKVALWPATLSSGPESGLCNQIFALVGWVIIARTHRTALILPNWTSHDQGGTDVEFVRLFSAQPFIDSVLRYANVHVFALEHLPETMRTWRPTTTQGGALAGWRKYKSVSHAGVNISNFEKAVMLGLTPSEAMRKRVDAVKQELVGSSNATERYGCLHARIETDMVLSWRVNRAGPPALLRDYLQTMGTVDDITSLKHVFVAVGLAISAADNEHLKQSTPWGARLTRSSAGKAWHRGKRNASEASYVEAALVDFTVCREAQWLVAWPGTTFGRTLAAIRVLAGMDDGGWYMVCPAGGRTAKELGPTIKWVQTYGGHQDCMAPNATFMGAPSWELAARAHAQSTNRSSTKRGHGHGHG